jgi:aldose sugar dehydrogenase
VNHRTKLYNFRNGGDPEYCGYYRIDLHSGSAAVDTPFVGSDISNIDKTFAHGIRNSFRLVVDPINGDVCDTGNGPFFFDKINLIDSGFNSGWRS